MSRLTQALEYMNKTPKELSKDWVKFNMTSQSVTPELKRLRRKTLKEKRDDKRK